MTTLRLRSAGFLLFAATVFAAGWAIIHSSSFGQSPGILSLALTIDFVVIVPLVYLFLVRPKSVPAITVAPLFLLTVVIATLLLPADNQVALKILGGAAESFLVTYLVYQAVKIRKRYRVLRNRSLDFHDSLRESLHNVIPYRRAAAIFLTEISLFYFAVAGWSSPGNNSYVFPEFTTYKKSGYLLLAAVIVFLLCIETAILHFFVSRWNSTVAWILTGLSLYALVFFFGDANALRRRPLQITEAGIMLRVGVRWSAFIPFGILRNVETVAILPEDPSIVNLALMRDANCIIRLATPVEITGLYGFKKTSADIALSIDDLERFRSELERSMANTI